MKRYGTNHLTAVAVAVSRRWPVAAKFPPASVTDRWSEWTRRTDYLKVLEGELAAAERHCPSEVRECVAAIDRQKARIKRLMVPPPYLSWEHIADFHAEAEKPIVQPTLATPLPLVIK